MLAWHCRGVLLLILLLGVGSAACSSLLEMAAMNAVGIAQQIGDEAANGEQLLAAADSVNRLVGLQFRLASLGRWFGLGVCVASVALLIPTRNQPPSATA